jgi:hypothetical protein
MIIQDSHEAIVYNADRPDSKNDANSWNEQHVSSSAPIWKNP